MANILKPVVSRCDPRGRELHVIVEVSGVGPGGTAHVITSSLQLKSRSRSPINKLDNVGTATLSQLTIALYYDTARVDKTCSLMAYTVRDIHTQHFVSRSERLGRVGKGRVVPRPSDEQSSYTPKKSIVFREQEHALILSSFGSGWKRLRSYTNVSATISADIC